MATSINALLIILALLRLGIGIQLVRSGWRNRLPNLYWLGAVFLITFLGIPFYIEGTPFYTWPYSPWAMNGVTFATGVCNIIFIHQTFYSGKQSPVAVFLFVHLLFGLAGFYALYSMPQNATMLNPWVAFFTVSLSLIWAWHSYVAFSAYAALRDDVAVEDWIKARYRLMIAFSVMLLVSNLASVIRVGFFGGLVTTPMGGFVGLLGLLTNIFGVVLQFLAWVMPEAFRLWLNRNQKVREDEYTYQQAGLILDLVGVAMSGEGTGVTKIVALFAIREYLSEQLQTQDQKKIEKHVAEMSYDEWRQILVSSHLYNKIKNASVRVNLALIQERAQSALIARQSLFTMQAR